MLARIRKSMEDRDQGFTLIELLVVMIIIGILAAIAIPVFLSQRAKARDTATKSDVSTVGKELATYFVDGTGTLATPSVTAATTSPPSPPTITIADASGYSSGALKLSDGTAMQSGTAGWTATPTSSTWCIGLTNTSGSTKNWKYSATGGLQSGSCP